jgi:plastocyanin
MRSGVALVVTAVLGVATAALPALAGSETLPAVEAVNVGGGIYGEEHHWSPAQVSVAAGGTVSLSNPSEVKHGVEWVGGPSTPSCTAGVPVGASAAASGVKWSGSCTFATAGVYTFYCTVHGAAMSARVTVGEVGGTTTTSTTPTSPGTGSGGSAPAPEAGGAPVMTPLGSSGSLLSASAARAIKLAPGARAATIRGTVGLSALAAGGHLEVQALVRRGSRLVRVGRLERSRLRAGSVSFTLPLDAGAARSLRAHHRLAVTVRLALVPLQGQTLRITRSLVLHR